ncbi:MAG: HNH endonuclease [Acidimicrobiia bacterium]|nr:HNH endonuclease [Acidimicrobiia bacterium]
MFASTTPIDFDARILDPVIDIMEPGIFLAAALSQVDLETLSGHDRVMVLEAYQRMASYYMAQMYDAMGSIADAYQRSEETDREDAIYGATAEVRAALRLTRRAADTEFAFSVQLATRLPQVADMLRQGLIDVRRAKAIDHATVHLSTAAAQSVVERIAEAAPNLTTSQIMARIKKLSIEVDPATAHDEYEVAISDRRVVIEPTVKGTANLHAFDMAPNKMAEAMRRINTIALGLKTKDETRTMDQLRADIVLDLLLDRQSFTSVGDDTDDTSRATSTKHDRRDARGRVDIRVDLDTLAELTLHPGELAGYGPVIADIARQVALDNVDGQWVFTITDTETNVPLVTGITRRRPSASQKRAVQASVSSCVFPGCRMPPGQCDLDHIRAWADTHETCEENLAPLCRHDHRIKHRDGWGYVREPDGTHTWITKCGRVVTRPADPP